MKAPKVSDLLGIINSFAPFSLAEEWDSVGLQVGDPTTPVERVMVALDPRPSVIESAIHNRCQVLVLHHPLLFKPLKKLVTSDPLAALVMQAVRHSLSIIAAHTNYDSARGGMNDRLAAILGLKEIKVLQPRTVSELSKLVLFVPVGFEEQLLSALQPFMVTMGNYRDCSFRVTGTGTYRPVEGAKPFIGVPGAREEVAETRIEVLVRKRDQQSLVKLLHAAHPYEEPAFDFYQVLNQGEPLGLGRIGTLEKPVSLADFAQFVSRELQTTVNMCGNPEKTVQRIAICGGSGASLLRDACFRGADLLVTGDLKHHDATEAELYGLALLDAGHFGTEHIMVNDMAGRLKQALAERGFTAEVLSADESAPLVRV